VVLLKLIVHAPCTSDVRERERGREEKEREICELYRCYRKEKKAHLDNIARFIALCSFSLAIIIHYYSLASKTLKTTIPYHIPCP
jgi:hypothetical protein